MADVRLRVGPARKGVPDKRATVLHPEQQPASEGVGEGGDDPPEPVPGQLALAFDEEILAVPGIGEKTAQKILLSARALVGK